MSLTLRELLGFDVLREAEPQLLAGTGGLDRVVRWVHSSEIYEIWPLLSGGELLLTTGLGLAGPDAGARRHYVRQLAEVGLSGVALELGRSFAETPGELVAEAAAAGLPLIALRRVVPFIRITQAANTAIVDAESSRLRFGEQVTRTLHESLAAGAGVSGVLNAAGRLAGCPLVVLSAGGALLAMDGVRDHRDAWALAEQGRPGVPITVRGRSWGRVLAGAGSAMPAGQLLDLLERTSAALALAVQLTGSPPSQPDRQAAALLGDLVDARPGETDYRLRAGTLGFQPREGQQVVAIAVDGPEIGPAQSLVERAARALGTPRLAGRVGGSVLGLLLAGGPDPVGSAAAAVETARTRFGVPELTAALGHAVPGEAGASAVAATLRAARSALRLAVAARSGRRGGAPAVVTSRELALDLQLASIDRAELVVLARATLAPVIDWDAAHRSELVRTVEVLLLHGGSPTRAAAALHLGRQSLYQRIERIETLLGHPLDDARLHAALLLAATAHRLCLT